MSARVRRIAVVVTVLALIGCDGAVDPRYKLYPKGAEHYRRLKDDDFCGELPLFAKPDPKTMIGTVLDGAQRYVDPRTGRELRAILVLTVVNSKRVDRWYPREKLVGSVYVLGSDPSFGNCGYWLDEEKPVKPLSSEMAADVSGNLR